VSGAKGEPVRLCDQIRACCVILWQIRDQAEDFYEGNTWSQTIQVLATPLNRLSCALEMAAAKLQKKDNVRERLLWLFKGKEFQDLVEAIESEKSLLSLALQNNSTMLLQQIKIVSDRHEARIMVLTSLFTAQSSNPESHFAQVVNSFSTVHESTPRLHGSVDAIHQQQHLQMASEERQMIPKWLSTFEHFAQQQDKIARRQPGTCRWFLQPSVYQNSNLRVIQLSSAPEYWGRGKRYSAPLL
jgi:hypothetical protein